MPRLETLVIRDDKVPERRWIDRVRDGIRSYWKGPMQSSDAAIARFLSDGPPAASGVVVSDHTALAVSAFYSGVSIIAGDIASLPLFLYRAKKGGGVERFTDHPLNRVLHDQANPETTSHTFRQTLMFHALVCGNGYGEIVKDTIGRPAQIWNLEPSRVTPWRRDGQLVYRVSNIGGGDTYVEPRDMLHLKGLSPDACVGFDTVTMAREALGLSIAAERFGARFFSNGSQLGGILSEAAGLTESARENLRKSLATRHQGSDNAHRWMLAPAGSVFTEVGVNPRDSQFNELRVHQIREVARFLKIPVSMLGDLERSTFANHEQEILKYYTSCLRHWIVAFEQEANSKLIAPSEKNLQHVEFVLEGFLRADSEKRSAFYATMLQNGAMTVNEVRQRENLPPIEGGDIPRVALNTEKISNNKPQAQTAA